MYDGGGYGAAARAERGLWLSKGRQGWEIGESECVLLCLPYYTSPGSAFATSSAVRPPPRRHSPPTFLGSARSQRFWSLKAALLLLLPSTLSWDLWISITQAHFKFSIYSNEEQRFMYRIDQSHLMIFCIVFVWLGGPRSPVRIIAQVQ